MGLFTAINSMLGRGTWPPPGIASVWQDVELAAAFRSSDEERLRMEASVPWNAPYMLSPVPRMISRASANLLYGEPAEIAPATDRDTDNLERIVDENDLPSELHRAAMITSSEGEVWGRIVVDPSLLDVPIIEFVSRSRVIPHFAGRFVTGATFVTEWATSRTERYRLFETYEAGAVTCVLYRGSTTSIGTQTDLKKFAPTETRPEIVYTGIEAPLVVFIPNTIDSDPTRGYSDYHGLRDRFLALNETMSIGQGNQRLAGKKRAIVDAGYLNSQGKLPSGDDVYIRSSRQGGDITDSGKPLQAIDWSADHTETIAWVDHLIDTTLTFAGIAPQSVGRQIDGSSISGTALKLRMSHSLMEAAGKGRYFDKGLRRLLQFAQIIDGRPVTENGFGRSYAQRDALPTVTRADGLPRDDLEAAQQIATLVAAEAISIEERVTFLHPDWNDQQRTDEINRLRTEQQVPAVDVP